MLSLHKKKRIILSAIIAVAVLLPAAVFAANKLSESEDSFAAGTYNLVIMDDNATSSPSYPTVTAMSVRTGSSSGTVIDCPSTGLGYFTCSGLVPGTNYYLYPTFESNVVFDMWTDLSGGSGSGLGSTTTENTYYTMGEGDGTLLLWSEYTSTSVKISFDSTKVSKVDVWYPGYNYGPGTVSTSGGSVDLTINRSYTLVPTYVSGYAFDSWANDSGSTGSFSSTSTPNPTYTVGNGTNAITLNAKSASATSTTQSLTIDFSDNEVSSVKVCKVSGDCTGNDLVGITNNGGDSVSDLTVGTTYYLYPEFAYGKTIDLWINQGAGNLSSTSEVNPSYVVASGTNAVFVAGDDATYDIVLNHNCPTTSTGSTATTVNFHGYYLAPITVPTCANEGARTISFSLTASAMGATANTATVTSNGTASYEFNGWGSTAAEDTTSPLVATKDSTPKLLLGSMYTENASFYGDSAWWGQPYGATLYADWIISASYASVNLPTITKTGSTCWWQNKNRPSVTYESGSSITPGKNLELQGVCEPNGTTTTYTLTYEQNISGTALNIPNSRQCALGDGESNCVVELSNMRPYKTGYNFIGWGNDTEGADGVMVYSSTEPRQNNVILADDKTLYAIWNEYANVSWQKSSSDDLTIGNVAKGYNIGRIFGNVTQVGIRKNYSDDTKMGSECFTNGGTSITIKASCLEQRDAGNHTLYLVIGSGDTTYTFANLTIEENPNPGPTTYTITLNGNGATNDDYTKTTNVVSGATELGEIETLPTKDSTEEQRTVTGFSTSSNAAGATVEGNTNLTSTKTTTYTFDGWHVDSGSGALVASSAATPALQADVSGYTDANGKWTGTSDVTLYAGWTTNAGTFSQVTLPTIEKDNYTCKWQNVDDANQEFVSGASIIPGGNYVLQGVCEENASTPKPQEVSWEQGSSEDLTIENAYDPATQTANAISINGNVINWNDCVTESDGTITIAATCLENIDPGEYTIELTVLDEDEQPSTSEIATVTIEEGSTPTPTTYTITLDGNGATNDNYTKTTNVVSEATTLGEIAALPTRNSTEEQRTVTGFSTPSNAAGATVTGNTSLTSTKTTTYTFNGWYTTSGATTMVATKDATPSLKADVTGYTDSNGKWTKGSGATLYAGWTTNAGTFSQVTLPTIEKDNYTCKWQDTNNTSNFYTSGAKITPTGNLTLQGYCTKNSSQGGEGGEEGGDINQGGEEGGEEEGSVTWEEGQEHAVGSDKNITFKINYPMDEFVKLLVNGVELDSKHYTVTTGSTVITLNKDYLNSLDSGSYTATAVFTNDRKVNATFTVAKSGSSDGKIEVPDTDTVDEEGNPKLTPDTGRNTQNSDNSGTAIYFALPIVAVLGVCGAFVAKRAKAHRKSDL